MKLLIEFGTFYGLFWWVMCILYKDEGLNLPKVLNNTGLWIQTSKHQRLIFLCVFVLLGCFSLLPSYFFGEKAVLLGCVFALPIAANIGKIIHKMGRCEFCMESHAATLGAIGYSCYWLDPNYLYWGFLCASINGWLRTFINR